MKLFNIIGIEHPGRVGIYKRGEVVLADIDDVTAEQLWREGLPYLEPNTEGRKKFFPGEKPIRTETIRVEGGKVKPKKTASR